MPSKKIRTVHALAKELGRLRTLGKKIAFTNGCFDLLHVGHVRYLQQARSLGDVLVVALNSDESVRRLKGPSRPILPEQERAEILAALASVDFVTIFEEDDPLAVIKAVDPDILVKGGDWSADKIIGRDYVEARGGKVQTIPYVAGASTSGIIERIKAVQRTAALQGKGALLGSAGAADDVKDKN